MEGVEPNPYQSPTETGYAPPRPVSKKRRLDASVIGFLLSVIALFGAVHIARTGDFVDSAGALFAPSAIAGVLLSLLGALIRPSLLAVVGMAIGFFVSLYLATFWLTAIYW
jgi:hypothetical protein